MALTETQRLLRPDLKLERFNGYETIEQPPISKWRASRDKAVNWLKKMGGVGVPGLRAATAPALAQVTEHFYTIASFACADTAAWTWGDRPGLITAAALLLAFEMKVSRN